MCWNERQGGCDCALAAFWKGVVRLKKCWKRRTFTTTRACNQWFYLNISKLKRTPEGATQNWTHAVFAWTSSSDQFGLVWWPDTAPGQLGDHLSWSPGVPKDVVINIPGAIFSFIRLRLSKNWWDLSKFSVDDHHFPYSMDIIGGHWDWAGVDFWRPQRIAWFFNGDAFSGHGLLVADLAPFLDDIPVKGTRESWESPELIAVPVPGLLAMWPSGDGSYNFGLRNPDVMAFQGVYLRHEEGLTS